LIPIPNGTELTRNITIDKIIMEQYSGHVKKGELQSEISVNKYYHEPNAYFIASYDCIYKQPGTEEDGNECCSLTNYLQTSCCSGRKYVLLCYKIVKNYTLYCFLIKRKETNIHVVLRRQFKLFVNLCCYDICFQSSNERQYT
jgi:hypothetical protein